MSGVLRPPCAQTATLQQLQSSSTAYEHTLPKQQRMSLLIDAVLTASTAVSLLVVAMLDYALHNSQLYPSAGDAPRRLTEHTRSDK
eukprot:10467-Heterococcus_DN1.PRE.2